MDEHQWLAERFQEHRVHLRSVAYRMLGSASEAEDAVQEAWIRLSRSDTGRIENLGGWLTTVVARVSLDMLRSRKSRREEAIDENDAIPNLSRSSGTDPEYEALIADSVGLALLVVLETLTPSERVAFVLHDMFGVPFDEIAPIVGRSPAAARQLASRARRRVQGAGPDRESDIERKRVVVEAFLQASRQGEFAALLELLDPDVVVRADQTAGRMSGIGEQEVRGASAVARTFLGRAREARPALVDGAIGAVWEPGGKPRGVLIITITGGRIREIEVRADPEHVRSLEPVYLDA